MASHFFSLFIWNKKEPAKIGFNFRRTQKISDCAYFIFKLVLRTRNSPFTNNKKDS